MAKISPPKEGGLFSHVEDPVKRGQLNENADAKLAKEQEEHPLIAPANPKKAPTSPQPDLLYSTNDLQAILDKYEEERRKALEEEIKKASQNLPAMLPQQSVADYVNINRDSIKTKRPQIFEKIGAVNKSEHDEMQQKGGYKPINFNKGAPSSLDIMGKDNKPIYTLNYRSDGELVIAKVPPSISKGPMHLSLALQDANGENIEADKAAYFNISYGADGKIKSMNYPEPLEFEGDRCKFLIDNQPYYLKVDKATLDVLNAELAKNRGQGVKRAQDVGFEPALDDQEQQPQPLVHAPEAQAEVVALPKIGSHRIAKKPSTSQPEMPIGYMGVQEPAKPAQLATIIPPAMALGGMGDNHDTELRKAQQAMAEAVKRRVEHGKYNLPPDPIKVLGSKTSSPAAENPRHEVPNAQELRRTPVAQEALDPEMPQEGLHKAAQAVAEAVANMMPKAHEKPVAKTAPTPPPQKGDKAKPVVIGNAVKAQHDAAKPFGDPEHKKYSSPPPCVSREPLDMNKTPAKNHAVVPPSVGLGGKKAQPFGNPKHNEFAVPPGGFKNETPQWKKDRADNNRVAQKLRGFSNESASSPISPSPSPTATGAPPHGKEPKGRS